MAEYLSEPKPDDWPDLDSSHTFNLKPKHRIVRIYASEGQHKTFWNQSRHWGPTIARFDHHPEGPAQVHEDHSVWYGALEVDDRNGDPTGLSTSVAERFQDSRTLPIADSTMSLVICQVAQNILLLDVESVWLSQAGGNSAIAAGPRDASRAWAREIHEKYPDIDGVVWKSSVYPPGRAVVLWDTSEPVFAITSLLNRTLPMLRSNLIPVANHLGYQIAWSPVSGL